MYPLTDEQKRWWEKYRILRRSGNSPPTAVRKLFMEIIENLPQQKDEDDCIKVDAHILQRFEKKQALKHNRSRAAYIQHHSKNHVWGEDAILYPCLKALGFQTTIYLAASNGLHFCPYEQKDYGLKISLVNHDTKRGGGNHFDLSDRTIARDGNCMYAAVGEQMERCLLGFSDKHIAPIELKLTETEDKLIEQRRSDAQALLASSTTKELIIIYRRLIDCLIDAKTNQPTDSYLQKRMSYIREDEVKSVALRKILQEDVTNQYKSVDEIKFTSAQLPEAKEQLIHALSIEAGREIESFELLKALRTKQVNPGKERKIKPALSSPYARPRRSLRLSKASD